MVETVKRNDISEELINYASVSSLQRLGFILDEVLNKKELAEKIFSLSKRIGLKFYLVPLKPSGKKNKEQINDKWKLKINTEIEID